MDKEHIRRPMVVFEIWLFNQYVRTPSIVNISHNSVPVWQGAITKDSISFSADQMPGSNTLVIELTNKDENLDTILDDAGHIVSDTFVEIKEISIDDYMMRSLVQSNAVQQVNWAVHANAFEYMKKQGIDPNTHTNASNKLSFNGKYLFSYETPIDKWLLEKRNVYDNYTHNELMGEDKELFDEVKKLIGQDSFQQGR